MASSVYGSEMVNVFATNSGVFAKHEASITDQDVYNDVEVSFSTSATDTPHFFA